MSSASLDAKWTLSCLRPQDLEQLTGAPVADVVVR
jgi:hypothetical protein